MQSLKPLQKLGVKAIVLMILTSCLGIRWIPAAGAIGPSAIILWLLAALIFFLPLSLIVIELSLNHKENGGIYLWTRAGLGKRYGFYAAWFYWVNIVFFYPGLLTFLAANILYLFDTHLFMNNKSIVVTIVIVCFWLAVWLNIHGLHLVAKLTNLTGLFNLRLATFLILAGAYYLVSHHNSATDFTIQQFVPKKDIFSNLANISLLMFALSGIELTPTVYTSIKDPEKNLPKAIVVGTILLVSLYILGTISINLILSPHELNISTGLVESFFALTHKLHWSPWVAKFLILSLVVVEFGSLNVWLIAPTVMFFHCAEEGILPNWLQQLNHNNVPANALIFQGIFVSVLILLTQYLPTVNSMYMVLVLMATIIFFLPYLLLSISYLRLRKKNMLETTIMPNFLAIISAASVFISISMAICFSFVPTSDLKTHHDILLYETELISGPVIFIFTGIWLYKKRKKNLTTN